MSISNSVPNHHNFIPYYRKVRPAYNHVFDNPCWNQMESHNSSLFHSLHLVSFTDESCWKSRYYSGILFWWMSVFRQPGYFPNVIKTHSVQKYFRLVFFIQFGSLEKHNFKISRQPFLDGSKLWPAQEQNVTTSNSTRFSFHEAHWITLYCYFQTSLQRSFPV